MNHEKQFLSWLTIIFNLNEIVNGGGAAGSVVGEGEKS
jgi:hypothetical protein